MSCERSGGTPSKLAYRHVSNTPNKTSTSTTTPIRSQVRAASYPIGNRPVSNGTATNISSRGAIRAPRAPHLLSTQEKPEDKTELKEVNTTELRRSQSYVVSKPSPARPTSQTTRRVTLPYQMQKVATPAASTTQVPSTPPRTPTRSTTPQTPEPLNKLTTPTTPTSTEKVRTSTIKRNSSVAVNKGPSCSTPSTNTQPTTRRYLIMAPPKRSSLTPQPKNSILKPTPPPSPIQPHTTSTDTSEVKPLASQPPPPPEPPDTPQRMRNSVRFSEPVIITYEPRRATMPLQGPKNVTSTDRRISVPDPCHLVPGGPVRRPGVGSRAPPGPHARIMSPEPPSLSTSLPCPVTPLPYSLPPKIPLAPSEEPTPGFSIAVPSHVIPLVHSALKPVKDSQTNSNTSNTSPSVLRYSPPLRERRGEIESNSIYPSPGRLQIAGESPIHSPSPACSPRRAPRVHSPIRSSSPTKRSKSPALRFALPEIPDITDEVCPPPSPTPDFELAGESEWVTKQWYEWDTKKWCESRIQIKLEPTAFAEGSNSIVHRLLDLSQPIGLRSYVAKIQKGGTGPRQNQQYVEMQALCQALARVYNSRHPPKPVYFLDVQIIRREQGPSMTIERYMRGRYVKHNSTDGFVPPFIRSTPQAFSHWTYDYCKGSLVVVGMKSAGDYFTNPEVHTSSETTMFGSSNQGLTGIQEFLNYHICNRICQNLQISSCGCTATTQSQKCSCYVDELKSLVPVKGSLAVESQLTLSISSKQFDLIVEWFTQHDPNNSGAVHRDSILLLAQGLQWDKNEHTKQSLDELQVDSSGNVNFIQFVRWWCDLL